MEVRVATAGDAAALSRVHAETWEDTYVGQVPDALAHERIAKARTRDWAEHGERRTRTGGGVVVLIRDQQVVGFCEFGPTEDADDDPQRIGHIMRLYVHPLHQRHGGGKLLVESACARLARDGYDEATLWTLEAPTNRAHGFYAHLGWTNEGIRNSGQPPDVRYRRRLLTGLRPSPTRRCSWCVGLRPSALLLRGCKPSRLYRSKRLVAVEANDDRSP